MAQKVQVLLVDDLDGGEASETVSFALDGNSYEIDLSGEERDRAARRRSRSMSGPRARPGARRLVRRAVRAGRSGGTSTAMDRDQAAAIRVLGEEAGPQGERPRPDPGHDHRAVQPVRLSRSARRRRATAGGRGARSAGDLGPRRLRHVRAIPAAATGAAW